MGPFGGNTDGGGGTEDTADAGSGGRAGSGGVGGSFGTGGTAGQGGAGGHDGVGGSGGTGGSGGVGGLGGTAGTGGQEPATPIDPPAQVKDVYVACGSSVTDTFQTLPWELSIDPTPIESGQNFSASFDGVSLFTEELLDIAQVVIAGGVREVNMLEFRATVIPHEGATGENAVMTHEPIDYQCQLESAPGVRPACDPANDLPSLPGARANTDCQPQGAFNPCGRFITLPTSDDCSPGGTCWDVGRAEAGGVCDDNDFCKPQAKTQCELNGFCVTGELEVPLDAVVAEYQAAAAGTVRFGWYQDTFWDLPTSSFLEPATPIGLRYRVGSLGIALDCVVSSDTFLSPPSTVHFISFPIPNRACTNDTRICPSGFVTTDDGRCRLTIDRPSVTVQDPSGSGACASPWTEMLETFLPFYNGNVLSSPSLVIRASIDAQNVDDAACVSSNQIIATVSYVDRQSLDVANDAVVFTDPSSVSVSAIHPKIGSTQIFPQTNITWSTDPSVCCERTFRTTFTLSVAQCEGW